MKQIYLNCMQWQLFETSMSTSWLIVSSQRFGNCLCTSIALLKGTSCETNVQNARATCFVNFESSKCGRFHCTANLRNFVVHQMRTYLHLRLLLLRLDQNRRLSHLHSRQLRNRRHCRRFQGRHCKRRPILLKREHEKWLETEEIEVWLQRLSMNWHA